MATELNLTFTGNETETVTFTVEESEGVPLDITGWTATMQLRVSPKSAIVDTFSDSGGEIAITGASGIATLTVPATATLSLSGSAIKQYQYDLHLDDQASPSVRIVPFAGTVTVYPAVSQ